MERGGRFSDHERGLTARGSRWTLQDNWSAAGDRYPFIE